MEKRRETKIMGRSVNNKITKVSKVILITIIVFIILFVIISLFSRSSDNKWKKHFFSKSDYKTISSVFGIAEGTFTLKEVIYCPCVDWHNEGDNNELYTVNIIMDDPSKLETVYNLKKDSTGLYDQDSHISSLNPDIEFQITSFLGKELNDPAPYKITFSYHGQNDELYDILPWISI